MNNLHSKRASTDRHGSQQRRTDPLPEPPEAFRPPSLREAVTHALIPLVGPEPVALHLALDDIKRVTGQPEGLAGQSTVGGDADLRDLLAPDAVAPRVRVHQVLVGQEPDTVGLGFAEDRDGLAAVDARQHAFVRGQFAHAVDRPRVQSVGAVGLRLQSDPYVLYRPGDDRVGYACESSRRVVLGVGKTGVCGVVKGVGGFKASTGIVEASELDRDL